MKDFIKEYGMIFACSIIFGFIVFKLATLSFPPDDIRLKELLKESKAIILTDSNGNKYVAVHRTGNSWRLNSVK